MLPKTSEKTKIVQNFTRVLGEVLVQVPGSTKMIQRNGETEKKQSEIIMTKRARTSPDKETSPDKGKHLKKGKHISKSWRSCN